MAKLADVTDDVDWETVICPVNDGHQGSGNRITDLSLELPGRAVQDFVWTFLSECLIQDRVLKIFRENGFTGFDVKSAKAVFKKPVAGRDPPRLWEMVITGWAGLAPPESGIKLIEHCRACGHRVYSACNCPGALINSAQWDGSDFFTVWPLPAYVFVTDRVAQVIRDNRLTGVLLQQPSDLDFFGNLTGRLTPGRLSYWMPAERARELGAALGID